MRSGLEDVQVRRQGRVALSGVSLETEPGRLVAVVGGDGAGKTTLLRALVGTVPVSSGRVHAPPRSRIGYLPAGSGVYDDLSVEENLRFAGAAYDLGSAQREARMSTLLEATGLSAARRRLAGRLSGGMRQKLAFACAMLHEPALLVMDEPTTGVDPVSRAELWRLVSTALAAGTAAVFATTYVDEAARADHVLVLEAGRPVAAGGPEQVRSGIPGRVVALAGPPGRLPSWRRGRVRHAWLADGAQPPSGATPVAADLEDAVVVAALASERSEEVTR